MLSSSRHQFLIIFLFTDLMKFPKVVISRSDTRTDQHKKRTLARTEENNHQPKMEVGQLLEHRILRNVAAIH